MESYIGDGLYVSVDCRMIKLRAPRAGIDHEVYMEDFVFLAFLKFMKENNPWPYVNLSKSLTSE